MNALQELKDAGFNLRNKTESGSQIWENGYYDRPSLVIAVNPDNIHVGELGIGADGIGIIGEKVNTAAEAIELWHKKF